MSITDEIKDKLDIVDYINQHVALKKTGRNYKACCPFHAENSPSFIVNPQTQTWRCFGACQEGGDVIAFAMKHYRWSFGDALRELGQLAGVAVKPLSANQRQQANREDKLRGILKEAASVFHQQLYDEADPHAVRARQYLYQARQLTDETMRTFEIGYARSGWQALLLSLKALGFVEEDIIEVGLALRSDKGRVYDRFRDRIVIPIRDHRGRVVGFGGRSMTEDKGVPKYINSSQSVVFDKGNLLFGLDKAWRSIQDTETVVIVEGYMDVITAHAYGFRNVVAQMGTALTESHVKQINRWAQRIVLALDNDVAGENAARRSLEFINEMRLADYSGRMRLDIYVLEIPEGKDPDELIRADASRWQALVNQAVNIVDYVIKVETQTLAVDATSNQRELVARRLIQLLIKTENRLYLRESLPKLSKALTLPESRFLAILDDLRSDGKKTANGSQQTQITVDGELLVDIDLVSQFIMQPALYYRVCRRFKKIESTLEFSPPSGALDPLDWRDFLHEDVEQIMEAFIQALRHAEDSILDYVRAHVDESLQKVIDDNRIKDIFHKPERTSEKDSQKITDQIQRRGELVNADQDVVHHALRLRCRRLRREREELKFLQENIQHGDKGSENHLEIDQLNDVITKLAQIEDILRKVT